LHLQEIAMGIFRLVIAHPCNPETTRLVAEHLDPGWLKQRGYEIARSLGDQTTRLDRIETALNEGLPGDPRDTTSPVAMLGTMHRLLLGDALSAASRERLTGWLVANKTGDKRLRAGMPGWKVGDKTGTGGNGSANDIAIVWPTGRAPLLVTVYYTGSTISDEARNEVIAEAGRIVAASLK